MAPLFRAGEGLSFGVVDALVLTQLVKIRLEDSGRMVAVNVEELLDKNYDPDDPKNIEARKKAAAENKPQWEPKPQRSDNRPQQQKARPVQAQATKSSDANAGQATDGEGAPKKKRRRRRRRKKSSGEGNTGNSGSAN